MEHWNFAREYVTRSVVCLLATLAFVASAAVAEPLSQSDEAALRTLSAAYVQAWLRNDREGVMGVMAPEAVFIPHDGVKPKIGYKAIDEFWFPGGKPLGTVTAYDQQITAISGDDRHATLYGRFDLTWQDDKQSFNWIGNFLIVARKDGDRWLATHMMASDEDPTIKPISGSRAPKQLRE